MKKTAFGVCIVMLIGTLSAQAEILLGIKGTINREISTPMNVTVQNGGYGTSDAFLTSTAEPQLFVNSGTGTWTKGSLQDSFTISFRGTKNWNNSYATDVVALTNWLASGVESELLKLFGAAANTFSVGSNSQTTLGEAIIFKVDSVTTPNPELVFRLVGLITNPNNRNNTFVYYDASENKIVRAYENNRFSNFLGLGFTMGAGDVFIVAGVATWHRLESLSFDMIQLPRKVALYSVMSE